MTNVLSTFSANFFHITFVRKMPLLYGQVWFPHAIGQFAVRNLLDGPISQH